MKLLVRLAYSTYNAPATSVTEAVGRTLIDCGNLYIDGRSVMSSYKLTYFAIAGLAEPIRFLLSYGGIDYEDNRVPHENWPAIKPQTPFGQVPILEVDGKTLYQSNAIVRFLANKLKLFGSSELEHFEVDAHVETIGDLRSLLFNWTWAETPENKIAKEAEIRKKAAFYLGKLEASVKENGGYFVGGKLSAADIVFAGFNYVFSYILGNEFLADYPNLKNLVEKVNALPGIKSHIAKRPKTLC
ncbi:glutathione S-transferase-like [Neodiprion fabricii]|uniref:glutathione S-transferase-like n=1 Tax=Neodiprion fabricii TaxID=2872261 RepID=UPI001ED8D70F|nr:glutathione S-transferase-like [Neodiprion fabricii]